MDLIHVAVAVMFDSRGRVLIARRPPGKHLAGCWEFPGGKLEPGEAMENALRREIAEELGVEVLASEPVIRLRHDYPDRRVLLDVHEVTRFEGRPRAREAQELAWVAPDDLPGWELIGADRPIVNALRLPGRYLITPPEPSSGPQVLRGIEAALAGGIRLMLVRLPDWSRDALADLVRDARSLCTGVGARLLVHDDIALARSVRADGVHLSARALARLGTRPADPGMWLAASCHDRGELDTAVRLGLDFAVLGPVKATASHPERPPMGWRRFRELADGAGLPVYALGGLGPCDMAAARRHGAQGIAAIRAFWRGDGTGGA